jgi:hypothetical protein
MQACERPVLGRQPRRDSTVTVESLSALEPQPVVDAGTVDGSKASTAQPLAEQAGLACAMVAVRLADSARQLRGLGSLTGPTGRRS